MDSDWSLLPPKALRTIFSCFSLEELVKITCVCKSWYEQIKLQDFDETMEDGANEIEGGEAENPGEETNADQGNPIEEMEVIEIDDSDGEQEEPDGEGNIEDQLLECMDLTDIEDDGSPEEGDEDDDKSNREAESDQNKRPSLRNVVDELAKTIPRKEYADDEIKELVYIGLKYRRLSKKAGNTDEERDKYIQLNKSTRTKLRSMMRRKKKEALIRLGMIEEGDYIEKIAKFGAEDPKEAAEEASPDLLDPSQIKQEKEDVVSSCKLSRI